MGNPHRAEANAAIAEPSPQPGLNLVILISVAAPSESIYGVTLTKSLVTRPSYFTDALAKSG